MLEAICTFSQDKQIRHLPDAIKLLSHVSLTWSVLAWYHTTTALYKHKALQVENMRDQTQTVKDCIQQKSQKLCKNLTQNTLTKNICIKYVPLNRLTQSSSLPFLQQEGANYRKVLLNSKNMKELLKQIMLPLRNHIIFFLV